MLNLDCDVLLKLNISRFPNLKPSAKFKAGTNVRLPLPEDLVKKNKRKKNTVMSSFIGNGSMAMTTATKEKSVVFSHSLLKKRSIVVHRALDNETPNQIARQYNVDVQKLIDANSKRFKGFRAHSRLIQNTEVIIPDQKPSSSSSSVARKTADVSSTTHFLEFSNSKDRWSRVKLLKMADSVERVLLSSSSSSTIKSKKTKKKGRNKKSSEGISPRSQTWVCVHCTLENKFRYSECVMCGKPRPNIVDVPKTVDGVPIRLHSKVFVKTARLEVLQKANVIQIEKLVKVVKVRYDEWDSAEFDEYHPLYCISLQSTNEVAKDLPRVGTDVYVRPTTSTKAVTHAYTASVVSTFEDTLVLVRIVDDLSPDWTRVWVPLSLLWSRNASS